MREKWPLPEAGLAKRHTRNHDRLTRKERIERYEYIWQEFGPPDSMLIMGGMVAHHALEEMRLCFMMGYYLACVLLAQVFIEDALGTYYIIAGEEKLAEKGFAKMINRANEDNLIDSSLASRLHRLRKMRNPYVHPKAGLESNTFIGRYLERTTSGSEYSSPLDFMKEDAIQAVETVVDFLRQRGELPRPPQSSASE